jgi:hypothetical protein
VISALLPPLLALGMLGVSASASADSILQATLSGASEVPPVRSTATGSVDANLNVSTRLLTWTVTYSGLSGPATAAHFHGPALAGQNAGVVVPLAGKMSSPVNGSATLTAEQVTDLMAGKWYLNVHTAGNPGGEIRGQVVVHP